MVPTCANDFGISSALSGCSGNVAKQLSEEETERRGRERGSSDVCKYIGSLQLVLCPPTSVGASWSD